MKGRKPPKLTDLDGDGLVDHVLRIPGFGTYWKRNISGKYGQLTQVNLPQGGNVRLEYAEKYGTVNNPNFKYVMSKVTVCDGCGITIPEINHGKYFVTTEYDYEDGYYNRKEKEFYGFKTVNTKNANETYQTDTYYMDEYYKKGAIKESVQYDSDDFVLGKSETILRESPYAQPKCEYSWTYEKSSGNSEFIHTETEYKYDEYGQRTRIEYGNETATDYTYNPERRWLETVKTKNKYGQSYQNIRYDFDRVGNVRSYVNDCMDTLSGNYKTDQSYEYDDLYQLIHVTGNTEYYPAISSVPDYKSTYTQDFAFDDKGLGNMMSKVSKETVSPLKVIGDNLNYNIGYVYDENYAHRLVKAGNRYYKYDANGNIICEQDGSFDGSENDEAYYKVEQHAEDVYSTDNGWGLFKDESGEARGQARKYRRTYTWNSRNQLVSSVDSNYSTSYVYGQDGQRSNKYTQGSETLYFNKMWTLHTDNGNSVYGGQYAKNVYLGETRIVTKLARADQKTAHEEMYKQYYYHSDHLGSATMISDWEGKEYQRIEYTPYGETWVEKTNNSGSEFLPYKFTGKEVDQETGLYYYGARYLDPKYSMWISTDPALGEYIPEMGKGNAKDSGTLPGMGGVYNHINFHLYHYAGNNPLKFVDPDGRFEIDDESQTIYCDLNNLIDLKLASIVFQKKENIKQCVAFDKKSDYQLTFTDKDQFKRIVDSYLLNAFSNVFSKVSDGVSLAQGIENIKGIEVAGNVVTGISVVSDSIQTVKNLNKGNKYGAASSAVDMGIDVIGFFGPEGAYFSVVLKYSKKGTEFGISELAKASVYLEREIVNEWTNTLFGVKFK